MPGEAGSTASGGPAQVWMRCVYTSVQVNVTNMGQNIVGNAANEPSIAVDPLNPARMVIGWRQFDTVASNFRQAGVACAVTGKGAFFLIFGMAVSLVSVGQGNKCGLAG